MIPNWNGEQIRVAFAMDYYDRELMSWVATTGGINGEMIRDLVTEGMEARLGLSRQVPMNFVRLADLEACMSL